MRALVPLLLAYGTAHAQGQGGPPERGGSGGRPVVRAVEPGGEYTPPYIWFEPGPRTFYAPTQSVAVHFCDAEQILNGSTRVWLNGAAVSHAAVPAAHPACSAVHRVATVSLTFAAGSNQVKARACETTATASCGTDSTTYVYGAADATAPTAAIATAPGTYTSPTLAAEVRWCDDGTLDLGSRELRWNGARVAAGDEWTAGTDACWSSARSVAALPMQNGANTLQASIRDAAGNLSNLASATFTYAPRLALVTPAGCTAPTCARPGASTRSWATPPPRT